MSDLSDNNKTSLIDFLNGARCLAIDEKHIASAQAAIEQRMRALDLANMEQYKDHLQVDPQEYQHFLKLFFERKRFIIDEPIWELIRPLLATRFQMQDRIPFRAWIIGCGTGEEAIGAAIALSGFSSNASSVAKMKIFATDIDDEALAQARQTSFMPESLVKALPSDLIEKYFVECDGRYVFSTDLRKSVIFGKHDVSRDPAICRMDLIVCRQVLSFFNSDIQQRIGAALIHALNERGYLILDQCERLSPSVDSAAPGSMPFVYHKKSARLTSGRVRRDSLADNDEDLKLIEAAFDAKPVATICVDASGTIAAFNSQARFTFDLVHQDLGKPLQDLEISYRPIELRSLIDSACEENREVIVKRVVRNNRTNGSQIFDVHIIPLYNGVGRIGVSIEYNECTEMYHLRDDLVTFNQQLSTANEELQSAHEELETTNEELHATNEELETTNEELQSTNEELETMNEELQSTNTELDFSNTGQRELATTVDKVNAFLKSILSSMQSAIIVIDANMKIQVWNQKCVELWGLRQEEVKEQDLFSLDIGFPVEILSGPIKRIKAGHSVEQLNLPAINRCGQTIQCGVQVLSLANSPGYVVMIDEVGKP